METKLFANSQESDIFGIGRVDKLKTTDKGFIDIVDSSAGYIVGLFYFISVIIGVYGAFVILTSLGDDEKVKKGKNIIIYVVIGLVLVFLAGQIVDWVINVMTEVSDENIGN